MGRHWTWSPAGHTMGDMTRGRETRPGPVAAAAMAVVLTLATSSPAAAQTRTAFAAWDQLAGSAGAYTTTLHLVGTGFPAADVTSDSRAGQVGVQTGESTWFSAETPPGQAYGSSRDQPYLNLRPRVDNPTSPSVTTYTFRRPTPLGWAFVLGDIDADEVTVAATLADGSPATLADLGFQGVFSLCDAVSRPGACPGPLPGDVPTWEPGRATLVGNPGAADSSGAAGWFEPTAPLSSLTLTFRQRSGLPIYQTWFMSRTQDVTGTVTTDGRPGCDVTQLVLRLVAPDGTVLATTTPGPDGGYGFDRVAATDDLTVRLGPADSDCTVVGPDEAALDLRTADGVADFAVAGEPEPEPVADVTGEVVDQDGEGIPDVVLDLDGPGVHETATTDQAGRYELGPVPPGDYTLAVDPPPGLEVVGPDQVPVVVEPDGTLVGDVDFVLRPTSTTPAGGPDDPDPTDSADTPVAVPTVIPSGVG